MFLYGSPKSAVEDDFSSVAGEGGLNEGLIFLKKAFHSSLFTVSDGSPLAESAFANRCVASSWDCLDMLVTKPSRVLANSVCLKDKPPFFFLHE